MTKKEINTVSDTFHGNKLHTQRCFNYINTNLMNATKLYESVYSVCLSIITEKQTLILLDTIYTQQFSLINY